MPAFCAFPGLSGSSSQRLGRPLPRCGVPFPSAASGSGSQRLGRPVSRCGAPFPSAASGSGSQRLGRPLSRCGAPFPSEAPVHTASRVPAACVCSEELASSRRPSRWWILRNSLDRIRGPVCSVGGAGFSGAEFAPFPSPCLLPPVGMGWLFSGVSQFLCLANRWRCVPAG